MGRRQHGLPRNLIARLAAGNLHAIIDVERDLLTEMRLIIRIVTLDADRLPVDEFIMPKRRATRLALRISPVVNG